MIGINSKQIGVEFVVVVIGVAVALAADSYREDLADREIEQEYLERLVDGVLYFLDIQGFMNIIVGPVFHRLDRGFHILIGGNHDHFCRPFMLLNTAQDLQTIQIRQAELFRLPVFYLD